MTDTHLDARSAEKEALGTLRVVQPTMPNGHRRRPYGETTSIKLPARAVTVLRGFVDDLHAGEIILEFRRVKGNFPRSGERGQDPREIHEPGRTRGRCSLRTVRWRREGRCETSYVVIEKSIPVFLRWRFGPWQQGRYQNPRFLAP